MRFESGGSNRERYRGFKCRSPIDDIMCRLWYAEPNAASNAVDYAKFCNRSHNAVIRVYDDASNVIQTHEHAGRFKEW